MPSLTFADLRAANLARLPHFKNRKGEPAHTQPDGSDWSLNDWATALTGEVGEAANILKKVRRGDVTIEEARPDLSRELADIQTYLDILAFQAGIDLGEATIAKWNEVSERVGSPVRIEGAALAQELRLAIKQTIEQEMQIGGSLSRHLYPLHP